MAGAPPDALGPRRSAGDRARRRLAWAVATALVVGFVALVVSSARRASVPVGAGGMAGMPMPGMGAGAGMRMSLRDVDGKVVRVPDGRPGVAVFVEPRDCAACLTAVRAAARAVQAVPSARLVVVSVDAATSRGDVAALARAVASPRARYVVDDRNGSLASMFDASRLGSAAVYDGRGRLLAHPSSARQLRAALARARS